MLPDAGENWELIESNTKSLTYVTQTSYSEPGQMFIWSHPIDLHFSINDLHGWYDTNNSYFKYKCRPRAIFKVWRLDSTNKIDICN
jgi:B9 domain-containing protein 2